MHRVTILPMCPHHFKSLDTITPRSFKPCGSEFQRRMANLKSGSSSCGDGSGAQISIHRASCCFDKTIPKTLSRSVWREKQFSLHKQIVLILYCRSQRISLWGIKQPSASLHSDEQNEEKRTQHTFLGFITKTIALIYLSEHHLQQQLVIAATGEEGLDPT